MIVRNGTVGDWRLGDEAFLAAFRLPAASDKREALKELSSNHVAALETVRADGEAKLKRALDSAAAELARSMREVETPRGG